MHFSPPLCSGKPALAVTLASLANAASAAAFVSRYSHREAVADYIELANKIKLMPDRPHSEYNSLFNHLNFRYPIQGPSFDVTPK